MDARHHWPPIFPWSGPISPAPQKGGHRRIFPKSYAKECCAELLPLNSTWQPHCATKKTSFISQRPRCRTNGPATRRASGSWNSSPLTSATRTPAAPTAERSGSFWLGARTRRAVDRARGAVARPRRLTCHVCWRPRRTRAQSGTSTGSGVGAAAIGSEKGGGKA
jgi:hypothetical protein